MNTNNENPLESQSQPQDGQQSNEAIQQTGNLPEAENNYNGENQINEGVQESVDNVEDNTLLQDPSNEAIQNQDENNLQPADNGNEENEDNNNEQSTDSSISSLIASVNNAHLMSEENIEAIREVLCKKENIFYKLSPRDKDLEEELATIIKWKAKVAEATIGQALNYYHQKLLDSELNHLDKLMKILKSTKREMFLKRLTPEQEPDENESNGDPDSFSGDYKHKGQSTRHLSLRDLLPEYDPQRKFIRFKLNDRYEVYLKAFEEKQTRKASLIDRIPLDVLQNHILVYFNSFDLFKVRAVCSEWRESIRGMWHIIFKREMMEQIVAADLCNDIEMNFKLMSVKSPFYQKFGIFMKAITEIIDWDVFLTSLDSDDLDVKIKMLVITFFRMIGISVGLEKLSDFQETDWFRLKEVAITHIKTFIDSLFHHQFQFKSNYELDVIKANFLDCADISSDSIRQLDNKNAIMFQLFLRQLLVFAQLKNYISLAQSYIIMAKDKLKEVSKEWPHKKDFLEGAYKILLFKFIEIRNGQVIVNSNDNERRTGLLINIQTELNECMSITSQIQNQPDLQKQPENTNTTSLNHKEQQAENDLVENKDNKENGELSEPHSQHDQSSKLTLQSILDQEIEEKNEHINSQDVKNSDLSTEKDTQIAEPQAQQNVSESTEQGKPEIEVNENVKEHVSPECDLNTQLAKIIQLKANSSSEITFEKFLHSKEPDYLIERNGAETRLYLDDLIKIEFLIQKLIKQHLVHQNSDCSCPFHESAENQENEDNGAQELKEENVQESNGEADEAKK